MRYYLICNWKMNPSSYDKARTLLTAYNKILSSNKRERWANKRVVVCPPYLYFHLFDEQRARMIKLGAQDVFWKSGGSYTGKVSAKMAKDFGVEYAIIGHSELRIMGDNNLIVNLKIKEALRNGITPVVCVGYKDYRIETRNIVGAFSAEEVNRMIFAYEPYDAIGSKNPASVDRVALSIRQIRKVIVRKFRRKAVLKFVGLGSKKDIIPRPAILYGGSVSVENYKEFLTIPDLNGFVLGRESLKPQSVNEIIVNMDKGISGK